MGLVQTTCRNQIYSRSRFKLVAFRSLNARKKSDLCRALGNHMWEVVSYRIGTDASQCEQLEQTGIGSDLDDASRRRSV